MCKKMCKNKPVLAALIHAVVTLVYIVLVAWLMSNGDKLFGAGSGLLSGVAVLLLFVLSAAIVGLLVLGWPVKLYLDGDKKEAVKFLFWTLGWLVIIVIVVFVVLALC